MTHVLAGLALALMGAAAGLLIILGIFAIVITVARWLP